MYSKYKCPNCGGYLKERKSRSKGAKDRFRCFGKEWERKNYKDGKLYSITSGFTPSCGLFGIKDLNINENAEEWLDAMQNNRR